MDKPNDSDGLGCGCVVSIIVIVGCIVTLILYLTGVIDWYLIPIPIRC